MSEQRILEEQEPSTDQATFFWTFLDEAIMKIEQAHLLFRNIPENHREPPKDERHIFAKKDEGRASKGDRKRSPAPHHPTNVIM